jgi:Na+-driven multidrug efflux pump
MSTLFDYKAEYHMIKKGYIRYMIPTVIGLAFGQLAPLVDSLCISKILGGDALSAMSTVNPVYYFFNIVAVLGGIGGGIGISKSMGTGNKYQGGRIFTKAMIFITAATVVLSALCLIFMDPLLGMLCATERNYGYAKEYLTVLLIGMIFYVFNNALTYILMNDNDANLAMAGGIVTGVVNMLIDYVGMYILHHGIWVAAFGTVIGELAGCLVFMLHRRKKDRICRFTPHLPGSKDIGLKEILTAGMPEAAENLLYAIQILQSNYILRSNLGTEGVANAAVIENLVLVAAIVMAGICDSLLPIFSSYHGEGNKDINRQIKRTSIIWSEALISILVASLVIYPQWFMSLLSIDEPVMLDTLPLAIRIIALAQTAVMINGILVSFMQSTDDETRATVSLFIQGLVQLAMSFLLVKVAGANATWFGVLISHFCVVGYFVLYCGQFKNLFSRKNDVISMITGGKPDRSLILSWQKESEKYLSGDEAGELWSKIFEPFSKVLGEDKKTLCSFMILNREDGHKAAVLRYDLRNDILGEDENAGTVNESGEDEEIVYGECIRSEFNYMRRMMLVFK